MRAPRLLASSSGIALATLAFARDASALDKQGSAHGGAAQLGEDGEKGNLFDFEGAVMLGMSLYNPSYAARPNNTGLTLFRYAVHADMDLLGKKLSIPIDVNAFTDSQPHNGTKSIFKPTEGDVITGVTSTWDAAKGEVEVGVRVERDAPLDEATFSQTYVDMRARYIYSLKNVWPGIGRTLADGDISGFFTLGWFTYNPTYAARPDNSGIALLRYAWHYELSVWHDHVSFGADAAFFSDRRNANPIAPSELDFTPEVILRRSPYELHLAFETDHPVDRPGLVQSFVYALVAVEFDLIHDEPPPLEQRTHIISP